MLRGWVWRLVEGRGKNNKVLRKEFPHLKEWCGDYLWASSCYHGFVGSGWDVVEEYMSAHNILKRKHISGLSGLLPAPLRSSRIIHICQME